MKFSPRQKGFIKIFPKYKKGLLGLKQFDYLWVLSMLHLNHGYKLTSSSIVADASADHPPSVGLFSSRAPHRPNPIGLSAVQITHVDMTPYNKDMTENIDKEGIIEINGLDLLDGTPILDIKPYIPAFDSFPEASAGWMDNVMSMEQGRMNGYQTIVSKRGGEQGLKGEQGHVGQKGDTGERGESDIDDIDDIIGTHGTRVERLRLAIIKNWSM